MTAVIQTSTTESRATQFSETVPSMLRTRREHLSSAIWIAAFLFLHGILGIAVRQSGAIAAVHAIVILGWGLFAAIRRDRMTTACAAAYIAGAEVLWRMVQAPIPWQFGSYSICLVLGIGVLRARGMVWRFVPLLYFILLLPSIAVRMMDPRLSNQSVIQGVSEYLPAPLALALSVWFYSLLSVTADQFRRILLAFVAPCVAAATVTLLATYSGAHIAFTDESNFITSNGFGPNQVSAALGLGALLSLLYAVGPRIRRGIQWLFIVVILVLVFQTTMTFSRGGLYAFAFASVLALPFLIADRRSRKHVFLVLVIVGAIGALVVLPRLEQFTGGALSARFQDTNPTRRGDLVRDDLLIWEHHTILGVGPGGTRMNRETTHGPSHTEYTRLLAEHGVFGFVALALLLGMAAQAIFRSGSAWSKGVRIALVAGSMLSMGTAAMRIAAFGLLFGLAHIEFCRPTANGRSQSDTLYDSA